MSNGDVWQDSNVNLSEQNKRATAALGFRRSSFGLRLLMFQLAGPIMSAWGCVKILKDPEDI